MAQQPEREETAAVQHYAIAPEWFPAHQRDFPATVQSRMCPSCQARLGTEVEERVPSSDAAGRVVFESRRVRYGADPVAVVAEHCATQPAYRNVRLPLMEIIFRLLLANRNRPMTVEEITQQVMEWVRPGDGRIITPLVIERLLQADDFYGIRPVEEPRSMRLVS
ncbi:MAG: hypothetical protein HY689_01570 [Chloroflexi bacterium]|nr:hypothetical protein [Chloroflexota bacterium]